MPDSTVFYPCGCLPRGDSPKPVAPWPMPASSLAARKLFRGERYRMVGGLIRCGGGRILPVALEFAPRGPAQLGRRRREGRRGLCLLRGHVYPSSSGAAAPTGWKSGRSGKSGRGVGRETKPDAWERWGVDSSGQCNRRWGVKTSSDVRYFGVESKRYKARSKHGLAFSPLHENQSPLLENRKSFFLALAVDPEVGPCRARG